MGDQMSDWKPLPNDPRVYRRVEHEARPRIIVKYVKGKSPFGVWLMVTVVFFVELTDHGVDAFSAVLITMICMLLAVVLS